MSDDTVRVAVRIRPLVQTEVEKGCRVCLDVVPGIPQIQVRGTERAFTFNYVFASDISQEEFYNTAIKGMVTNIFQGYNVTILAYGQTGSGKTHSMGTNYSEGETMGVIPRAVHDIFEIIQFKKDWDIKVSVSFIELYQEQVYDLLSDKPRDQCMVDIREDAKSIKIAGLTEKEVTNVKETFECLIQGSLGRATGATAMNEHSSRSHAIFTVSIHQQKQDDPNTATTAKFHLVDLAGSERSKKTQATGERFKEGVNINKGLLALGNVISQLGEGSATYIGYRDSKLTRLLQDSLGGNSMTLMIACVSPADYNLDETISTLRYANRARKIKNKPIVNQDQSITEISRLNKLIQELRLALLSKGNNITCPPEHEDLQEKNRLLQKKLRHLTEKLNANLIEFVHMHERAELAEQAREKITTNMSQILEECKDILENFNMDPERVNEQRTKLEAMYSKILYFQNDQKKSAEELLHYELSSDSQLSLNKINVNSDAEENDTSSTEDHDEADDVLDLQEKHEEHTMRQAERSSEVQNINKELALKEELVSKLLANASHMIEYSKELQDMEKEIKTLHAEKEELLQTLHNVQANSASSKLAEARRKKVQELEKKISELSRKCVEQSKVIKMKEKSDLHIRNLSDEIQLMKKTRVKLIRQMRTEAERFNIWKQSREQELGKLKDQDRKRQNQMARMASQHNKQQNVLKRKVEEACAINKRLKEALDMQKKAQLRREKAGSSKQDIRAWVGQELEVLLSTVDAERSLERLMQDRALLAIELEKLKTNSEKYGPAAYEKQITALSEDLELRSAQIADLQQKILESDQENKAKTRLHTVQSMADAKAALKTLFEVAADIRKKQYAKNYEYEELTDKCDKLHMKVRQYELLEKVQEAKHRQEMAKLQAEHEERMAVLLQQLRGDAQNYSAIENGEITQSMRELETKTQTKEKSKKSTKPKRTMEIITKTEYSSPFTSDDSLMEDDVENDPDWTKTPLYNRIQKLWNTTRRSSDDSQVASKRSSDGDIKCMCKTTCSTRLCSCRKNDVACTNCNCNPETCQNKDTENIRRVLFPGISEDQQPEESFKRPRNTRQPRKQKFKDITMILNTSNESPDQDIKRTSE